VCVCVCVCVCDEYIFCLEGNEGIACSLYSTRPPLVSPMILSCSFAKDWTEVMMTSHADLIGRVSVETGAILLNPFVNVRNESQSL
jgi:hypothetical protein